MARNGLIFLFTIATLVFANTVRAAELTVSDLFVDYITQSESGATGRVQFTLRLNSDESASSGFDLFSAQILIQQLLRNAAGASFTLDESISESLGVNGGEYWLPGAPTGFQNSSTISGEFRYTDFVSITESIVPDLGDVVASFAFDFEVTAPDQFGTYQIAGSEAGFNFFGSDLVNITPNTLEPTSFQLIPEPATGFVLIAVGMAFASKRKR